MARSGNLRFEFRVLGPFEVVSGGRVLEIASAKQQALLALLVTNLNRPVSSMGSERHCGGAAPGQPGVDGPEPGVPPPQAAGRGRRRGGGNRPAGSRLGRRFAGVQPAPPLFNDGIASWLWTLYGIAYPAVATTEAA